MRTITEINYDDNQAVELMAPALHFPFVGLVTNIEERKRNVIPFVATMKPFNLIKAGKAKVVH